MAHSASNTFCVLPWLHVFVSSTGKFAPCCLRELSISPSVGVDQNREGASIAEYRHSDFLKNVRRQMMAGEEPSVCTACFDQERLGGKSLREDSNDIYSVFISEILGATSKDGSYSASLRSADLRLGNACNLRCQMCFPESSSGLGAEWEALGLGSRSKPVSRLFDSDEFWISFFEENQDLDTLSLVGGEPMIMPRFHWILEYLIRCGRAERLSLKVHSNLTKLTPKTLAQLQRFRSCKLMISLDGVGEVNTYIRWPSSWDRIRENIRLVNDAAEMPFFRANLAVTVQAYNVLNLVEIIKFSLLFDRLLPPAFTILVQPSALSLARLPMDMRLSAASALEAFLGDDSTSWPKRWSKPKLEDFFRQIRAIINALRSDATGGVSELVLRTRAHDLYRGHSIKDFIPELAPLFEGEQSIEGSG